MWETGIAGAGGLMGLYVALRREVRRNYELLEKNIGHLDTRLGQEAGRLDTRLDHVDEGLREVRADIRRLDQKIDSVRGELIGFLGPR